MSIPTFLEVPCTFFAASQRYLATCPMLYLCALSTYTLSVLFMSSLSRCGLLVLCNTFNEIRYKVNRLVLRSLRFPFQPSL